MANVDMGLLKIIPFSEILPNFAERGRQEYLGIDELAETIHNQGLINPLTVYSKNGAAPFVLIAGGRRYKACEKLGLTEVAVRIYDHPLAERELRIIELFENLKRSDLTHAEEIAMTAEINKHFIALKGPKVSPSDSAGHSMRDTARILGRSQSSVQKDIKLHELSTKLPELRLGDQKNKSAAFHTARRLESMIKAQVNKNQAFMHGRENPFADAYRIGDFFSNTLPSESFYFLEVDPPYGIDLHEIRQADDKQLLRGAYIEVTRAEYIGFINKLAKECFRLAAPISWLILWCGPELLNSAQLELTNAGFEVKIVPAIWKKGNNPGQTQAPNTNLGSAYEMFIYARKGNAMMVERG